MSLHACGINPPLDLSPQQRELKPQGTLDFPCAGYAEHYAPGPGHSLPWHWHAEFEVIHILSGQLTVETPGAQYHLDEGDCIAVNAGVLHSANTATACEIRSLVFSQSLVTGGKDTVFAKKYITPLAGCRAFRAYVFDRQAEAGAIAAFVEAYRALEAEPDGYEFTVRARLSELVGWNNAFLRSFLVHASPVIANEFMWGLGTTLYSVAYGRMGDDAVAAITIATTIQDIVVVLWAGLSAATAVILGNELGAGRKERAEDYSVKFFTLSFALSLAAMLFIFLIRWPVISVYSITPEVARDVSSCILVFIAYILPKMYNYILVVGVLRSGGDTRMCLFLDTSGVWFLGVPLAFLGALVWKLPIYGVYALVLSEEIYKAILGTWRYRQKKWLRNIALEVN